MAKKNSGFYLLFLCTIPILLVCALPLSAQGETRPDAVPLSPTFTLVDVMERDTDYLVICWHPASRPDVVGLRELVAPSSATANDRLHRLPRKRVRKAPFHGANCAGSGEWSFRIIVELRGVNLYAAGVGGVSTAYHYDQFEAADTVLTNQGPFSTAQIQKVIATWAQENGIQLGPLQTVTFTFDRWRFDYAGVSGGSGKRVACDRRSTTVH